MKKEKYCAECEKEINPKSQAKRFCCPNCCWNYHHKKKYREDKEHREKVKEYASKRAKNYYYKNHEETKRKYREYRRKVRQNKDIRERHYLRNRTYNKYEITNKDKCFYCGNKEKLQRHHYTEPYEVDKFIIICHNCHIKEHSKK